MRIVTALMVLLAVTACGGDDTQATTEPTPSTIGTTSSTPPSVPPIASPIVGDWQRVMTCEESVAALKKAGLGQFAAEHVAGNEMVPGISFDEPELIDPDQPCKGAVPRKHGHFFTSEGLFGSTNHKDEQVDKGSFKLVDAQTVLIANKDAAVTFRFKIKSGRLYLDPVMPSCLDAGCWDAQWAVAVASPGRPWHRSER